MPRRLIACLLLALPLGCALQPTPPAAANLASLPLPDSSELPCCWQAQESLAIDYRGQRHTLTSVMAVEAAGLTLVVLDPLGRKLLTVTQRGSEVTEQLASDAGELPVKSLLPAVYLAHMNQQRWVLDQSPWSIGEQDDNLVLYFRHQPNVMVEGYTDGNAPTAGDQRIVRFVELGATLTITTLKSAAL